MPTPQVPVSRWMTTVECAAHIRRTPTAVRSLVGRKELPHMHHGRTLRFDREKIDRWMERQSRGAYVI